ncbi:MAG: hypothetical protein AVDCRST_MAG87-80, partial [uncultured Thermomicrobiales bacterium]
PGGQAEGNRPRHRQGKEDREDQRAGQQI